MSSHPAVAVKERPASMRLRGMDFWDGMEHNFMMPSVTAEGTGTHSHCRAIVVPSGLRLVDVERDLVFLCFPERRAVWDAVAGCIQEQLVLHKGVRIPALGCFDVVSRQIQVGEEAVTIHRPVFRPARNLVEVCNLSDNKAYLPGNKELEPLKYSKVATAASVSRQKAAGCIQGTVSLLSYCLGKGKNVAFVLRDIGVLLIEGKTVQMKFYYDFLEMLSGKENLKQVIFKVPRLLDMVVSRMVPVASLSFSGHVVIFPELEMEFVHKPPLRALLKTSRQVPGEDEQTRREFLPPLGQVAVGCPGFAAPSSPNQELPQFQEMTGQKKRKKIKSSVRQQPEILGDSSGEKQPGTGQAKGKAALKDRASKQRRAQAQALTDQSYAKTWKAKPSPPQEASNVGKRFRTWNSGANLLEEPLDEHPGFGATDGGMRGPGSPRCLALRSRSPRAGESLAGAIRKKRNKNKGGKLQKSVDFFNRLQPQQGEKGLAVGQWR
ncbi:uncharacterized protein LOC141916918 [Strix aluco]|uniref:uncharacterized protein LOC141916918 n=1 Tax=Strix aluco TaxID=111821 RepID=UPI003DA27B8E